MAFYDLKCDDCGHQFEKFVSGFLRDDDRVCPECGSRNVSQEFTGNFSIGGLRPSSPGGGCGATSGGGFG